MALENAWTLKIDTLEKENFDLKETIKNLRWEGDRYQNDLDKINKSALIIEEEIRKIRGWI